MGRATVSPSSVDRRQFPDHLCCYALIDCVQPSNRRCWDSDISRRLLANIKAGFFFYCVATPGNHPPILTLMKHWLRWCISASVWQITHRNCYQQQNKNKTKTKYLSLPICFIQVQYFLFEVFRPIVVFHLYLFHRVVVFVSISICKDTRDVASIQKSISKATNSSAAAAAAAAASQWAPAFRKGPPAPSNGVRSNWTSITAPIASNSDCHCQWRENELKPDHLSNYPLK